MAAAGLATVSETTLEWMLTPIYGSHGVAGAKEAWRAATETSFANGLPLIGRKPEEGGQGALQYLPIPGDLEHSIRLYPGGFESEQGILCFDFYSSAHRQGVPMPPGYAVFQPTMSSSGGEVELQGLHATLGGQQMPQYGESFLVITKATVTVKRNGVEVFAFTTPAGSHD
ncbi:hypothetical protein C8F01DRAFT_1136087 [Mycena amicta]|nr:hypothetical protein C8F01DRAFT_1136087 [Mycena amicta]